MKEIPDVNSKLRIAFDVDKTLAKPKLPDQKYEDLEPLPGAVETLKRLKSEGWYIIITSARNMRTYNHNIGQVSAFQTKIIIDWLTKWEIPFDEFWVKPFVQYFVDDRSFEFISWNNFNEEFPKRIIEDKISAWHDSKENLPPLHEYLGWTWEQYVNYVEDGELP